MTNAQDRAYILIKEQIINLKIKPNHRLRAQEFAKKLKSSRTPIREALSRLEQEGLVVRDGGWGYLVRPFGFKDILDLYKLRESLEVQAALEALANLDPDTLTAMVSACERAKRSLKRSRILEFRAANRKFHSLIATASRNDLLQHLLVMIGDRTRLIGTLHLDIRKDRAQEVLSENRAILDALRAKDPELVKAAVLAHIRNAREGFFSLSVNPDLT